MGAYGARRHVAQGDRPDLIDLGGISPNIDEFCVPYVAARQGKLHAGVNVTIGRNVASCMAGAAGQHIQGAFVRTLGRCAKFLDVSDEGFVPGDFAQRCFVHVQSQNAPVPVHHRRDRGIHGELRTELSGQRPHTRVVGRVLDHQYIGDDYVNAVPSQPAYGLNRIRKRTRQLRNGVMHFGDVRINTDLDRFHGAAVQNRSRSIRRAGKQEKLQPKDVCFFLTSPFIELIRMWGAPKPGDSVVHTEWVLCLQDWLASATHFHRSLLDY